MSDPITPEERAAIDAAIAKGRVQHIPQGVIAEREEIVWCGETKKLVMADTLKGKPAGWKAAGFKFTTRKTEGRRQKVRRLLDRGMTVREISGRLGVSATTIYKDIQAMVRSKRAA